MVAMQAPAHAALDSGRGTRVDAGKSRKF